jgi:hypothetical protein
MSREIKFGYSANVSTCPIQTDKQLLEFPALPEQEVKEIVLELKNNSKNKLIEIVPPNYQLSGLMINPLVIPLGEGKSCLVSVKYNSLFRNLTASALEDLYKPKFNEQAEVPKGMVARNRIIEEREKKKKEQADLTTNDPKKKGAPVAAPPKKEEAKQPPLPKGMTAA